MHDAAAAPEPSAAGWTHMIHGYAFLVVNEQGGPSGDRDFESVNHLMVSFGHALWGGEVSLLGTFSLEPVTVPPEGSPLLFQRGETYQGVLLIDRQHAHDMFMELAVAWDRALSKSVSFRAYVAPVGEAPVGPTAYTHRLSASAIPSAPLSHHNLDSTHLTADVISAGFTFGMVTIEAGVFHGSEPGENRFDIDGGPLDSYSGRVTVKPVDGLSLQVSAARREQPEALEEGNQTRQTISLMYEKQRPDGALAATIAWGRNLLPEDQVERGTLVEGLWTFKRLHTVTARFESVDRDVYELVNKTVRPETVPPDRTIVDTLTLGWMEAIPWLKQLDLTAGVNLTGYRYESVLDPTYGSHPVSGKAFVRLTFPPASAGAHHHH